MRENQTTQKPAMNFARENALSGIEKCNAFLKNYTTLQPKDERTLDQLQAVDALRLYKRLIKTFSEVAADPPNELYLVCFYLNAKIGFFNRLVEINTKEFLAEWFN